MYSKHKVYWKRKRIK